MPWVVIRIEESKDAEAEVRPATSRANASTQHTTPSSPISKCGVYQKRMKMNQCSTPIPATNRPTAINEVELWPGWPGALCCPWSVV